MADLVQQEHPTLGSVTHKGKGLLVKGDSGYFDQQALEVNFVMVKAFVKELIDCWVGIWRLMFYDVHCSILFVFKD